MPKQKASKPIIIKKYDYAEFAKELNNKGQTVLAIYDIDSATLQVLYPGTVIQWDDTRQNALNESEHGVNPQDTLIWNGEVFACFEDFVIVYLY
jgi:hypothetical protein